MRISIVIAAASISCALFFLSAANLVAQTEDDTSIKFKVEDGTEVSISVPDGGLPITYTVDGKQFSVTEGNGVILPAGVKNLLMPKGSTIQSREARSNGTVAIAIFECNVQVTLPAFTPNSIAEIQDDLILVKFVVVQPMDELLLPVTKLQEQMINIATVTGASETDGSR